MQTATSVQGLNQAGGDTPPSMVRSQSAIGSLSMGTPDANVAWPKQGLVKLSQQLVTAIKDRDSAAAETAAKQLSQLAANLEIVPKEDQPSNMLSVQVNFEDLDASLGYTKMELRPDLTIKQLKWKMMLEHGFPPEVQVWIIKKRIPEDSKTLQQCGLTTGITTPIYLYLTSREAVGMTPELYQHKYGALWAAESEIEPSEPSQPLDEDETLVLTCLQPPSSHGSSVMASPPQASQLGTSPQDEDVTAYPITESGLEGHQPQEPQDDDMGWDCPACTLKNIPTRPGCEMCGEKRPADYMVPAGYQAPESERRRLEQEVLLEQQLQEVGGADLSRNQILARLLENTELSKEQDPVLAQMLHLNDEYNQNPDITRSNMIQYFAQQLHEKMELAQNEEAELQRHRAYQELFQAEELDLVANAVAFECPVCFMDVEAGDGVMLRECLHMFCRECLADYIRISEDSMMVCPFKGDYTCNSPLQEREIKALVTAEIFNKYLQRGLRHAEGAMQNTFHCLTNDCQGWCVYEDEVNFFECMICGMSNCLTCRAIHTGKNCKQYQDELRLTSSNNDNTRRSNDAIQEMLRTGVAMNCPGCGVIVQKKEGCDWLRCSMCQTEICWVTRGPRRGANGCHCRENGRPCHPKCGNCH